MKEPPATQRAQEARSGGFNFLPELIQDSQNSSQDIDQKNLLTRPSARAGNIEQGNDHKVYRQSKNQQNTSQDQDNIEVISDAISSDEQLDVEEAAL